MGSEIRALAYITQPRHYVADLDDWKKEEG